MKSKNNEELRLCTSGLVSGTLLHQAGASGTMQHGFSPAFLEQKPCTNILKAPPSPKNTQRPNATSTEGAHPPVPKFSRKAVISLIPSGGFPAPNERSITRVLPSKAPKHPSEAGNDGRGAEAPCDAGGPLLHLGAARRTGSSLNRVLLTLRTSALGPCC